MRGLVSVSIELDLELVRASMYQRWRGSIRYKIDNGGKMERRRAVEKRGF